MASSSGWSSTGHHPYHNLDLLILKGLCSKAKYKTRTTVSLPSFHRRSLAEVSVSGVSDLPHLLQQNQLRHDCNTLQPNGGGPKYLAPSYPKLPRWPGPNHNLAFRGFWVDFSPFLPMVFVWVYRYYTSIPVYPNFCEPYGYIHVLA